jgi:hypothetical protein
MVGRKYIQNHSSNSGGAVGLLICQVIPRRPYSYQRLILIAVLSRL